MHATSPAHSRLARAHQRKGRASKRHLPCPVVTHPVISLYSPCIHPPCILPVFSPYSPCILPVFTLAPRRQAGGAETQHRRRPHLGTE
eukprot:1147792-Pyramimonas_sp.AAC.1